MKPINLFLLVFLLQLLVLLLLVLLLLLLLLLLVLVLLLLKSKLSCPLFALLVSPWRMLSPSLTFAEGVDGLWVLARLNRRLSFLLCYVAMIASLESCRGQPFSWAEVVASLPSRSNLRR
jgi:hypothetical protein